MNLSLTLQAVARHLPDHPAITAETGRLTYGGFEAQVGAIAGALRAHHGLAPGSRVAIVMENCLEFLPALFGIWRAGLTAVPINAKLHPKELAWIIENSQTRLVLATADLADKLTGLGAPLPPIVVTETRDWTALLAGAPITQAPTEPGDEAWLFYTSGTTGRPKGAVLTHRNLLFMCHAYYADVDFVGATDTMLHAAPLSHGAGLYGLCHVLRGSHNIVHAHFDAERILAAFRTEANVSMFAAPTMVVRLLNHPAAGGDTRGLKTITYGGAPMYVADLKRGLAQFGPRFFQLYGQGEAPMTISGLTKALHADSSHPRYEQRLASAGVARTGCAFRVVDEDGRPLPTGEVGEIITRSDCVMTGYWQNPDANAKSLRDGWLWTGDLGSIDAEGFLTLKDRSKDMIISGGSNIYPREIEEVLLTHPAVLECAVASRPHTDWGEEVIAFVVCRAGMAVGEAELDRLCLDNIARFKRPKGYRFVEALPKNNYGKILKTTLRQWLAAE
ncbi:MAG: class I adenylate-forming enzyme family protein [Hyphomicrobiaceae bacterium]